MSKDLQTLCDAVDGGSLMRHVGAFAQWEKLSGTAGEADSLRYIQAQLDALGFRTRLLSHDAYISLPGRVAGPGGQHSAAQHHAFVLASHRRMACGASWCMSAPAAMRILPDATCVAASCWSMASRHRRSRAARRSRVPSDSCTSVRTSICTRCASRRCGAIRPTTRSANCRRPWSCSVLLSDGAALRERLARGERPSVMLQAEVDTGWRKTPILEADLGAEAMRRSCCSPAITIPGTTARWTTAAPTPPCWRWRGCCVARRERWQRGLRLCFWSGHSHGRYSGSAWYVESIGTDSIVAVLIDIPGGAGIAAVRMSRPEAQPQPAPQRSRSGTHGSRRATSSIAALALPFPSPRIHRYRDARRTGRTAVRVVAVHVQPARSASCASRCQHSACSIAAVVARRVRNVRATPIADRYGRMLHATCQATGRCVAAEDCPRARRDAHLVQMLVRADAQLSGGARRAARRDTGGVAMPSTSTMQPRRSRPAKCTSSMHRHSSSRALHPRR